MMFTNVTFRDNGIRSFVPPCLCFDVLGPDGNVLTTVSQVQLGENAPIECGSRVAGRLAQLLSGELHVSGRVVDYDTSPSTAAGRRFIVS